MFSNSLIIHPLATVLTCTPHWGTKAFKKTRHALEELAREKVIPELLDKRSEMLFRPNIPNAFSFESENHKTLSQRYGSTISPFFTSLKHLAKDLLEQLGERPKKLNPKPLAEIKNILFQYGK